MAPPTSVEVYDYIEKLIAERTPENHQTAFEWRFLLDSVRRHFNSTSPAIERLMSVLVKNGDLVPVEVTYSGFVHIPREVSGTPAMWTLYFRYTQPPYAPDQWGRITASRPKDDQGYNITSNLWANGNRNLYTTGPRFKEMIAHFTELKKRRAAEAKERQNKESARFWELLHELDPDASVLLRRLRAAAPKAVIDTSMMDDDRPYVSLTFRDAEQVAGLLKLLRAALDTTDE